MALLIRQLVANDQQNYTIQDGEDDRKEMFIAGEDTPTKFPESAFGALRIAHHARVWTLTQETHIIGQNKKIIQTGYKGDLLVEEESNRISIYKKDEFPNYFITRAGKFPTIHTEVVADGVGVNVAEDNSIHI